MIAPPSLRIVGAMLAAVVAGLASAPLAQAPGSVPLAMGGHFNRALEVHAAVIRGDVAAAGIHAEALAVQLEDGPKAGSPTALGAVIDAARAIRSAPDVLTAAQETAAMLGACGRCHRASRVVPQLPAPSRAETQDLAGKMRAHSAAAEQLLQGLVVPSDASWNTGARALAAAPMVARELPLDATLRPRLTQVEERLQRLGAEAAQTSDPRGRAAFYAQFLAACADCHRAHRPR